MNYHVTVGDRTVVVTLSEGAVTVDGRAVRVGIGRVDGGPLRSLVVDGASHRLAAVRTGEGSWRIHLGGRRIDTSVVDERTRTIRAMTGDGVGPRGPRPVVAPMPGMVVRVEVAPGEEVRAGQGVVIVEAMKMENELVAEGPGRVSAVHVGEGEAVEKDQILVSLEPLEAEEAAE